MAANGAGVNMHAGPVRSLGTPSGHPSAAPSPAGVMVDPVQAGHRPQGIQQSLGVGATIMATDGYIAPHGLSNGANNSTNAAHGIGDPVHRMSSFPAGPGVGLPAQAAGHMPADYVATSRGGSQFADRNNSARMPLSHTSSQLDSISPRGVGVGSPFSVSSNPPYQHAHQQQQARSRFPPLGLDTSLPHSRAGGAVTIVSPRRVGPPSCGAPPSHSQRAQQPQARSFEELNASLNSLPDLGTHALGGRSSNAGRGQYADHAAPGAFIPLNPLQPPPMSTLLPFSAGLLGQTVGGGGGGGGHAHMDFDNAAAAPLLRSEIMEMLSALVNVVNEQVCVCARAHCLWPNSAWRCTG